MKANYHTHTYRCHHGFGSEWEYIENAIDDGMEILGFSDHTPYPFPEGYRSGVRMTPDRLPQYIETVEKMKALYTQEMHRLCKAARETGIPPEINLSGYRYKRIAPNDYPNDRFWKIAGEEHCLAVLGSDSHRPRQICVPEEIEAGLALAAKYGVKVLETLSLKEDFLR